MRKKEPRKQPEATRRKLIEATLTLMLKRGFNATTVDEICAEAGVTKGAFFHHFKDKEDIALAAVRSWAEMGLSMYAEAFKEPGDPLEELHRIFEIMEEVTRKFDPCVCMVGMMTQEMSGENPAFRAACGRELKGLSEMFRSRLQSAKEQLKPAVEFDPEQVAWGLTSLWQGSLLVAKSQQSQEMIRNNLKLARKSDWLGMERTTLVRNLRPLEREGFVQANGGGRGGHVELTITEKGRKTLAKTLPAWRTAQDRVVAIFGKERWSNMIHDLEHVAAELKNQ